MAERKTTAKKKEAMIEALRRSGGNVSVSCKSVGINRKTHYDWIEHDQKYADAVEMVAEETGDYVEGELMKHIRAGNLTAIIFYCKTKLKSRGYVEKNEIEQNGNMTIEVDDF